MNNEIERPEGFPLPEEKYRNLRRGRMVDILDRKHRNTYSEWCLRGSSEDINPIAILAIFPTVANTPSGYALEKEEIIDYETVGDAEEYWKKAEALSIPERIQSLERHQYEGDSQDGDKILKNMVVRLISDVMPSAVVLFSKSPGDIEESVLLISPKSIPPSVALKHFLKEANNKESQK